VSPNTRKSMDCALLLKLNGMTRTKGQGSEQRPSAFISRP
jgi:hypothetical protein